MITPAPLAVALAANWWSNINPAYLKKLIPKIDEVGLTKFFCERLQQLHFSPNAQAIAAQMCGATGPLCNAEVLSSELGSRLFRTMVELNPVAAMSCLWRTFSGADFNTLRNTLEGRRNLVWALEKLCWSSDTFPQACELMLKFAWAENETWGNNATGQFKQLFHLLLSGTQVPGEERLKVIDRYVNSPEPGIRRLCLDALGEGLRTSFFSRQSGVEVRGSGLPEKDWEPKNDKEAFSYIQSCYKVLAEVAIKKTSDSDLAKQIIGSHLREILREGFLDLFEKEFRGIAKTYDNYWPEAYNSLNDIYSYDRKKFSPQSITRLKTWEKWITPKDIKYRIDKYIINAGYEHKEKPNGGFIDVSSMKAKKFANEMAKRSKLLYENIDSIQQGKQRLAFIFGCHVARKISDSKRFIEESIASLRRIPKEKRNIDLLNGFLFGSGDTKLMVSTIKSLSKDSELIFLVPAIVARLPKLEIAVLPLYSISF